VLRLAAAAPRSGDAPLPEVLEGFSAKQEPSPCAQGRSLVVLEIVIRKLRSHCFLAAGANQVAVGAHGVKGKGKGKGKDKGKGEGKGKGKGKSKVKGKGKDKSLFKGKFKGTGAQARSRVALEIVARALCSHCSLVAGVRMVRTLSAAQSWRSTLACRVARESLSRLFLARCALVAFSLQVCMLLTSVGTQHARGV
jgi:hypothetical protein